MSFNSSIVAHVVQFIHTFIRTRENKKAKQNNIREIHIFWCWFILVAGAAVWCAMCVCVFFSFLLFHYCFSYTHTPLRERAKPKEFYSCVDLFFSFVVVRVFFFFLVFSFCCALLIIFFFLICALLLALTLDIFLTPFSFHFFLVFFAPSFVLFFFHISFICVFTSAFTVVRISLCFALLCLFLLPFKW